MATTEYVGSQCWKKTTNDDGTMNISNNSMNYVMKEYNEVVDYNYETDRFCNHTVEKYWDQPKKKVNRQAVDDGGTTYTYWAWEYIYDANGQYPLVSGDGAVLTGGAKNDTINNTGAKNVNINGGEGNDSITNSGTSAKIDGGGGNDNISNKSSQVTIDGGEGNDYIFNDYGSTVKIDGGEGDDNILNEYGSTVKIDAGNGDNKIYNGQWGERWLLHHNHGGRGQRLYLQLQRRLFDDKYGRGRRFNHKLLWHERLNLGGRRRRLYKFGGAN